MRGGDRVDGGMRGGCRSARTEHPVGGCAAACSGGRQRATHRPARLLCGAGCGCRGCPRLLAQALIGGCVLLQVAVDELGDRQLFGARLDHLLPADGFLRADGGRGGEAAVGCGLLGGWVGAWSERVLERGAAGQQPQAHNL
jgi:hypothetical protein